jgi:hypothetical protein
MRREINFLTDKRYQVFICTGKGKTYRERGAYSAYGTNYVDAAEQYASHYNKCSFFGKYGVNWRKTSRKKGLPKRHQYLMDENGNKILLIAQ